MKIAIDIDNTLTQWPAACQQIIDAFPGTVLLTGFSGRPTPYESLMKIRTDQVSQFLRSPLPEIHICVSTSISGIAVLKGEFCRDREIMLAIDDHDEYCQAIRRISPQTAVWKALQ